jgi:hypothetical protein
LHLSIAGIDVFDTIDGTRATARCIGMEPQPAPYSSTQIAGSSDATQVLLGGLLFGFGLSVTSDVEGMVPTGRRADSL